MPVERQNKSSGPGLVRMPLVMGRSLHSVWQRPDTEAWHCFHMHNGHFLLKAQSIDI